MTGAEGFSSMDIELLARECSAETQKFFRREPHQPLFCFELLCRAYRDQLEAALSHVYTIYLPILARKARQHPLFHQSSQDADSFARTTLSNFYHAVRGKAFLEKFQTLAQAIKYMFACVYTVVLEDVQYSSTPESSLDGDIPSLDSHSDLNLQELWAHVCGLLPTLEDQQLAYLRFVLEMKPSEISANYPQTWSTARAVSVALQNIRRYLRADPYLSGLVGPSSEQLESI